MLSFLLRLIQTALSGLTLPFRILWLLVVAVPSLYTCLNILTLSQAQQPETAWWVRCLGFFPANLLFYFSVLAVITIIWLWLDKGSLLLKLALVLCLIFGVYNALPVVPYYLPQPRGCSGKTVKLLHMNVYRLNPHRDWVANAIQDYDADIVELMEYDEAFQKDLEERGIFKAYPYRVTGKAHMGLYSKLPLSKKQLFYVAQPPVSNNANILVTFTLNQQPVTLITAHPHIPLMKNIERQQQHFNWWKDHQKSLGNNVIIMGDFNTTPWAPWFQQFLKNTGMRDSQLGFGVQPSWPHYIPPTKLTADNLPSLLPFIGITIDHVLVSPSLVVVQRKTGPYVGSDHQPVFVEIGMK